MSFLILNSLRSLLLSLRDEIRICKLLVEQNNLQHRRTLYWKSFLQVLALARKVEQSLSGLVEDNANDRTTDAMIIHKTTLDFGSALQETADVCHKSLKRSIALCAARIATPHRGAGFASLASVILAITAKFIDLEYKIRSQCLGTQEKQVVSVTAGVDFIIDGISKEQEAGKQTRYSSSSLLESNERQRPSAFW